MTGGEWCGEKGLGAKRAATDDKHLKTCRAKLRDGWVEGTPPTRLSVMKDLIRQRYLQNEYLVPSLLQTGGRQLRHSTSGSEGFWATKKKDGTGANHMGRILMEVPDELRLRQEQCGGLRSWAVEFVTEEFVTERVWLSEA